MQIARWLIAFVAIYNFGGLLFDFVLPRTRRMHIYNPSWPPHAKFHNGQTMLLGIILGTLTLTILFAVHPLTLPMFLVAAATGGAYFVAMTLAPIFPHTAWVDPEFAAEGPKPFGLNYQQFVTYVMDALLVAALALAALLPV